MHVYLHILSADTKFHEKTTFFMACAEKIKIASQKDLF
jgi:hypothetical protein